MSTKKYSCVYITGEGEFYTVYIYTWILFMKRVDDDDKMNWIDKETDWRNHYEEVVVGLVTHLALSFP